MFQLGALFDETLYDAQESADREHPAPDARDKLARLDAWLHLASIRDAHHLAVPIEQQGNVRRRATDHRTLCIHPLQQCAAIRCG